MLVLNYLSEQSLWILIHILILLHLPLFLCRDKTRNTGRITCRVCLEDFQTTINFLSEAVDVYNDWIDACETAN